VVLTFLYIHECAVLCWSIDLQIDIFRILHFFFLSFFFSLISYLNLNSVQYLPMFFVLSWVSYRVLMTHHPIFLSLFFRFGDCRVYCSWSFGKFLFWVVPSSCWILYDTTMYIGIWFPLFFDMLAGPYSELLFRIKLPYCCEICVEFLIILWFSNAWVIKEWSFTRNYETHFYPHLHLGVKMRVCNGVYIDYLIC